MLEIGSPCGTRIGAGLMNFAGREISSLKHAPRRRIRLIRYFRLFAGIASLAMLSLSLVNAVAQEQTQPAPVQVPPAQAQPPAGPAPAAPPLFPKPDPANFTASSPTKETVNTL